MSRGPLVVAGDAILDVDVEGCVERVCPDAPVPVLDTEATRVRPGGAALAAVLAAGAGDEVVLVTALGRDSDGELLRETIEAAGVEVVDVGHGGPTCSKTRLRSAGQSLLRLDTAARADHGFGPPTAEARSALRSASAVLVSDYGRGLTGDVALRSCLEGLPPDPLVWDPHPRGSAPVAGTLAVTPNLSEAAHFAGATAEAEGRTDSPGFAVEAGRTLAGLWGCPNVAVTLGRRGAVLVRTGTLPVLVGASPHTGSQADPCGAGDRFASSLTASLARGVLLPEAVAAAVDAATDFVRSGGASSWTGRTAEQKISHADAEDAFALARRVRAEGGTVVATGGCFDLVHSGHVHVLREARRQGDCLVVCLNSDESVTRLKGPGRPVVPQGERATVIGALDAVDAVVVFEEDTPAAVLERLRPHLFVKGGDYSSPEMAEVAAMRHWGGEVAVVPYRSGRSSTHLIEEVRSRAR